MKNKNKVSAFAKEAIRTIKSSGTVAPSSKYLSKKMLAAVDFDKAKVIVEFGTGNGCITRKILSQMRPDAKLISFEINDVFYEMSKSIDDDRLIVINRSADEVDQQIEEMNISKVDYVISSLPLAILSNELIDSILTHTNKVLKKGGMFVQFQYSLNEYKKLKSFFTKVRLEFTLLNLPPAFVYTCSNA